MDLYWDRISAGHYETTYYVGKYKYKITGEGVDWTYYRMYRHTKLSERHWVRIGWTSRLKEAKRLCASNAKNPRRKFKIKGRDMRGMTGFYDPNKVPHIHFVEILRNYDGTEYESKVGGYWLAAEEFYATYSKEIPEFNLSQLYSGEGKTNAH